MKKQSTNTNLLVHSYHSMGRSQVWRGLSSGEQRQDKMNTTKTYVCDGVFSLLLSGNSWPQEPVTMIIRQGKQSSNSSS